MVHSRCTAIILKVGHHNICMLRIGFYNFSITSFVLANQKSIPISSNMLSAFFKVSRALSF